MKNHRVENTLFTEHSSGMKPVHISKYGVRVRVLVELVREGLSFKGKHLILNSQDSTETVCKRIVEPICLEEGSKVFTQLIHHKHIEATSDENVVFVSQARKCNFRQ